MLANNTKEKALCFLVKQTPNDMPPCQLIHTERDMYGTVQRTESEQVLLKCKSVTNMLPRLEAKA